MKVCQESRNSEGIRSALPSQACSFTCPEAPSSVTPRFTQGKPAVHPRLISFATLTAGLRSSFALSCFVRFQVCSFTCPEGTQFSHPSLRSGQTFVSPSSHCRASSGFSSQVSALPSQLSLNGPLIPKAAEPAGAHCNWHQHHEKDPAEHFWAAIPVKFARRGARGGLSDNIKAQAMCSAPFAQ